ncbi:MAG: tetratricopeptide repeat protein [Streptosporangiales bacterium]
MYVIERVRLAETYLDQNAPLAALETLHPVEDELAGVTAGELLLARGYFGSAQLSRAEEAFRRVIELDPVDDYAHFALGRTLERQGRGSEAAGYYRMAVAMNPRPEYQQRLLALEAAASQSSAAR